MKQEILTLEQEQVADMLLSLKNSHRCMYLPANFR